jgi:ligand-binding sensor domain-containing protein
VTALLLCLLAVTAKGIGDRPVILDGATDPYASEFVFFGTGQGIYTYNRASGTWSRITTANGLPDNRATIIALDDGILWVATAAGLASADVRINDWQTYDLPGETRALAFDDKYVWVGGDSGLTRFDKYAETWNVRGDAAVNDLFAEKGLLWIATDAGVQRCDARFDRIDEMPAPSDTYVRIINTPGRVWFAGRHHLTAFNKSTESWSGYGPLEIDDYATLGDSVVIASRGRGFIYEPGADRWAQIREAEEIPRISGIFAGSDGLLLATSQGLLVYNQKENSKKTWNRNNGLITDTLTRVYADQRLTFTVSAGVIQLLDRQKGTWQHEDLVPAGAKKERLAYLDDAGAHLALVKSTDIRLAGRASYSDSRTFSVGKPTRTNYENIGLNLAAQHRTGRSLSLYYDDSDPDQVAYGLGYRGIGNDLLHRTNAGRLETEYSDFTLIPRFSTLGGNVRLKHDAHSMNLQAGKLQSSLHSEFFTGRSVEKTVRLPDLSFARGTFYLIPRPPPPVPRLLLLGHCLC